MATPVLMLPPNQSNYVTKFGHTVVSVALDGGASRFRVDQLGGAFVVDAEWTLSKANYDYMCAFYRTAINFGSQPFILGLILDSDSPALTYTCHFLPDTFGLASQSGQTYVVKAQLEVTPDPSYYTNDASIIAAGPQN